MLWVLSVLLCVVILSSVDMPDYIVEAIAGFGAIFSIIVLFSSFVFGVHEVLRLLLEVL